MEVRPYDGIKYQNSAELCEQMAAECDTAILAFSCGKDSLASWLQMRRYFKRVIPYYQYYIPGMKFVEDSLKYYEDFFGCHIYRMPHPSFFRWLRQGVFLPAHHLPAIKERYTVDENSYTSETIAETIRRLDHLPEAAFCGIGIRKTDSLIRRVAIDTNGAIIYKNKTFYPVYDWLKEDMLAAFKDAGVKLPVDYRVFGRSFDGMNYQYLAPLKEYFPEDYKLLLRWFPLAELEFIRYGENEKAERWRINE